MLDFVLQIFDFLMTVLVGRRAMVPCLAGGRVHFFSYSRLVFEDQVLMATVWNRRH